MIAEPQVPGPGEVFLDHVGWFAANMDEASRSFGRLGFLLTPYTEHRNSAIDGSSVPAGTANRCAMLERGYLEIVTAVKDSDAALTQQLRAGLARGAGVHVVAFTCSDAERERARLSLAGFDPQPVVHLRRPVVLDNGAGAVTAFSVVRTPPSAMPEGRIQFLQQQTPELVWQPALIARDNGIEALTGVLIAVRDVDEAAGRFARFTGRRATQVDGGCAVIALDRGRLAFAAPESLQRFGAAALAPPFIAAVGLRSSDLDRTRSCLNKNGIRPLADADDHIVVGADDAAGTALLIHAQGADERLHSR